MTEPTWCSRRRDVDDQLPRSAEPSGAGIIRRPSVPAAPRPSHRRPPGDTASNDFVILRMTPRPCAAAAGGASFVPPTGPLRGPLCATLRSGDAVVAVPLSGDVGVGVAEVVLHGALRDAERTADAD